MEKLNKIKKKNCVICGKEFLIEYFYNHNKKTCDDKCRYELARQITQKNYERRSKIVKKKKCKNCNKEFEYKATHNRTFCGAKCLIEYQKEKRIGKGNPNYKDGKSALAKYGGKRAHYSPEHFRACTKYKKHFLEKNGYLFCEHCGTNINGTMKFETHHIYFASRHPKHKALHNFKNLILLCIKCHNQFHNGLAGKELLTIYETKRGLKNLFYPQKPHAKNTNRSSDHGKNAEDDNN